MHLPRRATSPLPLNMVCRHNRCNQSQRDELLRMMCTIRGPLTQISYLIHSPFGHRPSWLRSWCLASGPQYLPLAAMNQLQASTQLWHTAWRSSLHYEQPHC
jgi:hypothetical protein